MAQLRRAWLLTALFFGVLAYLPASATEGDFRILYSEAIGSAALTADPDSPGVWLLSFEAYGRQFDLELQVNQRLLGEPPTTGIAHGQVFALYRGKIRGLDGSWVRLTKIGEELQGAVWDGQDLYAIEPARTVAPLSVSPVEGTDSTPTVYRLSDVVLQPGSTFCGLEVTEDRKNALAVYDEAVDGLTAQAASGALRGQLQISILADMQFASSQVDPQNAALARINIVDGIFSEQVGVTLRVPEVRVFNSTNNPFTTNTPSDLLSQVASYRAANASIRGAGLTHLFTGRDLTGDTVGIAYLSALCQSRNGVSLSESRGSTLSITTSALIAAHEIGHNFGAPHDGESGSACSSSAQTFLMAPRLNGSNLFSPCSVTQMNTRIASASCITPVQTADGALSAATSFSAVQNQAFDYVFDVTNSGTGPLNQTTVTTTLPAGITVDSATASEGSCTNGAGTVTCDLGAVAAETTRRITLRLRSSQSGLLDTQITLTAANDNDADNDHLTPQLNISAPPPEPAPVPVVAAPAQSGGGGGGSFGWLTLLALGILACRNDARRRVVRCIELRYN